MAGTGVVATPVAAASTVSLWPLFLVFAKIGSVLFGSGYVLLAFLRSELVVDRHWLTEAQLLDAVAEGQFTPGPDFTTATFVGYLVSGTGGAVAATLGIFLPAFFFVAISGPLVPRLRRSPRFGRMLDGLNVASLALMAVVTATLARTALVDVWTIALASSSGVLLFRTKISSAWLVLGGVVAGYVIRALA
jgi:chromate transporter